MSEVVTIQVYAEDVSAAVEAGRVLTSVYMNGTPRSFINLDGYNGTVDQGEIIFNDDSQDIDFRVESNINANAFFMNGLTGNIGIGIGSPDGSFHMQNSITLLPELRLENTNNDAFSALLTFRSY